MVNKYQMLLKRLIDLEFSGLYNKVYWNKHWWKLCVMCHEWDKTNGTR